MIIYLFNMNILNKYYYTFLNESLKSDINYQLVAGIIQNNKLLLKPCYNINRNYCRGSYCNSLHAEANAILQYYGKYLKFNKFKNKWYILSKNNIKLNIIVIRFTKNGLTGNARPCYNCLNMMKDTNINKVYYTTGNDDIIISENVSNMISIHISSVARYLLTFTNKNEYFDKLIRKLFPKHIKEINLIYFLQYNLKNILPDYKYNINYKNKIIYLYNNNNELIISSIII